jgi:hypothetical protein
MKNILSGCNSSLVERISQGIRTHPRPSAQLASWERFEHKMLAKTNRKT